MKAYTVAVLTKLFFAEYNRSSVRTRCAIEEDAARVLCGLKQSWTPAFCIDNFMVR